LKKIINIL